MTQSFTLDNASQFTLTNNADAELDLFHYSVSSDGVTMPISILGIDTDKLCGPLTNIDLVYFVWDNFIRFCYKRYALALTPQGVRSLLPHLAFAKHYRVESDGWKDSGNCDDCRHRHQEFLLPFHACGLTPTCACKICSRQPPSLADCARHVLFRYTLHLDRFCLATDTTYDQYVYAVRSNHVPQAALLTPEAPTISECYSSSIDSPLRFHRDCLCAGPWLNQSEREYTTSEEQIRDLVTYKTHFWCHHCEKGLFFPLSCVEHADTIPVPNHANVAQLDDVADVAQLDDGDQWGTTTTMPT